jgi:uncharacterized membrane protein
VHLFDDIRGARSDLQVLGLYLPVYVAFFAAGFGGYVVCLDAARRHARINGLGRSWPLIEVGLHALCAVGIYLGRVVRLNSWHVFTRPRAVFTSLDWLIGPLSWVLVAVTFAVLVAGTALTRSIVHAFVQEVRPFLRRHPGIVPGLR